MTEIGAQELGRSFDCKVHGCPLPAKSARGRFAYLCEEHTAEKQCELRAAAPAKPAPARDSIAAQTLALVPLAGELDRAIGHYGRSQEDLRAALDQFSRALTGIVSAAQAALRQ